MIDLSKSFIQKKIDLFTLEDTQKLSELIKYHSDLYHNQNSPVISDAEYDNLFKKLQILEKKYNVKDKQSLKVGSDVLESSFEKVKHSRPMISLDNTYNSKEIKSFDERVIRHINSGLDSDSKNFFSGEVEYTIEFKFDGLGIELIYNNGSLIQAITRGNGIEGEDVTQNILQISNIPKNIPYNDHLEVRGEVIMPISSFDSLNKNALMNGKKVFSNPRNAASGSVRMKDVTITKKRNLKFFSYDISNFNEFKNSFLDSNSLDYYSIIKKLESFGFEVSSYFKKLKGVSKVIESIKNFGNLTDTLDFDIDGLVLKVNDVNLWDKIGYTQHHPRYAISYKFPAEIFTTKILSVDHQVGRTGTLTPVANLEPINIGGAIIKRATLHNYEEVEKLGIQIGSYVFIKRAGEVIPKIISLAGKSENTKKSSDLSIKVPELCPGCSTKIKKDDDKVRYYCSNSSCPLINTEKLIFAVGKYGFDIDGLGEKQVKLFLEKGYIKNLVDIFKIIEKREEILSLDGFKEKSVNNLISGVEKSKKLHISKFLSALAIPGVGKKTAKTISKLISGIDSDILKGSLDLEELEFLDDVGPEIGKNILDYFGDLSNQKLVFELLDLLDIEYYSDNLIHFDTNFIFYGKKVCISGTFISDDGNKISRDSLVEKLEKQGGSFISSVSKNTDFLLVGDKAGSKLEKAKKLGIGIISLSEFLEYIENK